jgi:DNA-binding LytR/AlgR family response regulator
MKDSKVLILEDQVVEACYLKETLLDLGYQVPAVATSLGQGLEYYDLYKPDISLVDIYLDSKPDGILFGMEVCSKEESKKPFLYLTGAADTSTFTLARPSHPHYYLIKPFNKLELQFAIELAIERHQSEIKAVPVRPKSEPVITSIFVKRGNSLVNVQCDEIKYIEVDGKYSKIVCYDQKFVVQQTLGDLHGFLPADQFLRVHRRYVINRKEINKIDTQTHEVFFKDGNKLNFSRRFLDEFLHIFRLIK